MQEILPDVLVETELAGVTVGALRTERGTILIDSPLIAKDGQNWRAVSAKTGTSAERLLVLLDEHYDRTIGARALRCPVLAHERTSLAFNSRPPICGYRFRAAALWNSRKIWETCIGLNRNLPLPALCWCIGLNLPYILSTIPDRPKGRFGQFKRIKRWFSSVTRSHPASRHFWLQLIYRHGWKLWMSYARLVSANTT